jgi:riboflavin synthase
MFTGIVQAVGRIESVTPLEQGLRLVIDPGTLECSRVALGDSICVQGACLTVVSVDGARLSFDVSRETLECTVGLDAPSAVNLEKSLALGDTLGGHLVTGHVDGVGNVLAFEPAGESKCLRLRVPEAFARYVARKGSITIDGVSLTVNRVEDDVFEVNLIPHTLAVTTLSRLTAGAKANLEVDLIARYVERMVGGD